MAAHCHRKHRDRKSAAGKKNWNGRKRNVWKILRRRGHMGEVGQNLAPFVSAPKAMKDLERMHISYLNSTYDLRRLEQWKAETVEDESGLEAIGKRLGYRFVVKVWSLFRKGRTSDYTGKQRICRTDRRGRLLSELERNGTLQKKIQIATDARLWKSGEKTTLCQKK